MTSTGLSNKKSNLSAGILLSDVFLTAKNIPAQQCCLGKIKSGGLTTPRTANSQHTHTRLGLGVAFPLRLPPIYRPGVDDQPLPLVQVEEAAARVNPPTPAPPKAPTA
jgi:hypothetical protein